MNVSWSSVTTRVLNNESILSSVSLDEALKPRILALKLPYVNLPGWAWSALHRDHDLALGVPFPHVPERLGDVAQLVAPVDHRLHRSGFEQLPEHVEVRPVRLRDEEDRLPAAGLGPELHPGNVTQRSEQAVAHRSSDEDDGRLLLEHAPAFRPRPAARVVEHQVVPTVASGEVL